MDRAVLSLRGQRRASVGGLPDRVQEPPEHDVPDGGAQGTAARSDLEAALESRGVLERDGAYRDPIEVLANFRDQRALPVALDFNACVNRRQIAVRKLHVDHGAVYRRDES